MAVYANRRIEIQELLRDSPSLTGQVSQRLNDEYPVARADTTEETRVSEDTFPGPQCPFTAEQMLDAEFWPK